ncbi:U32 family peptidase [Fibrobacter sp. UWB11]|uniref:U32 family peptidase n=1 Tax=Fibrobacter sp. UWB11 TaxID=1896202 RepID=UPI00092832D8|nr:U32 family peptidase [Fibrobacter sp. UWB11]SIN97762.1 putative protease [Fibrobacter sp. UWB11]
MSNPELLLPVGTRDMLESAINNGADAVYYGVPHWNARGRTEDFSFEDVEEMIRYARLRGVKTYLAMNILIFEREIQELPEFLERLIALKPDAFIIQDIGLARLIKAISPEQEIHASTQMTLASSEAVNLVKDIGFSRAVLARELSAKQIAQIKSLTDLELEVFIHGALCVSYSGQCLTSENFGGRSANRGQCAQSCRLPYRIFVDGKEWKDPKARYLFSTRDLCALPKLEELKEIGVESLKVEGRLKSPEYVAAVSHAYRKALETLSENNTSLHSVHDSAAQPCQSASSLSRHSPCTSLREAEGDEAIHQNDATDLGLTAQDLEPLEVLFSRGLNTGWLDGVNHQELVDGSFSNHHGEFIGTVVQVDRNGVIVELEDKPVPCTLLPGDGILFEEYRAEPEPRQTGSRLYKATFANRAGKLQVRLEFGREFNLRKVTYGMKAYRNDSPALEKELHKTFTDKSFAKHIPICMTLEGKIGDPLKLTICESSNAAADETRAVTVEGAILEASRNEVSPDAIQAIAKKELSGLSATAYVLDKIEIKLPANAFLPGKVLRTLRQEAVQAFDEKRLQWKELAPSANAGREFLQNVSVKEIPASAGMTNSTASTSKNRRTITVLVRRPEQIDALQGLDIDKVVMDFDWGVKYDEPLERIHKLGFEAGIATLRIHKPSENHYIKQILTLMPEFALVRNLGSLALLKDSGIPMLGDYSLNATNSASYDWLLAQGLEKLHPSWDLNSTQLFDLLKNIDGSKLELALHQYMPAFHSEYCAFARALTTGRRFPECKKICTQHKVEILDHKGERHFLQSDAECRNTLFVGKPQSALKLLPRLIAQNVSSYRLELLDEEPESVRRKIDIYTQAIRGKLDIDTAISKAGVEEKYGLSEGQLFNQSVWQDRKKG